MGSSAVGAALHQGAALHLGPFHTEGAVLGNEKS